MTASPRLPTFLIVGANKGGTSTLWSHLRTHPQVFTPEVKEPHFFTYYGTTPEGPTGWMLDPVAAQLRTVEDYASLFAEARPDQTAIGEASTGYLCAPLVPATVRSVIPDVRIIAILRDPVERAWSEWRMMRRAGLESRRDPFDAMADLRSRYVQLGEYGAALTRWFDTFPREQVRVYFIDDLERDPGGLMADLFAFVGVPPIPIARERRDNAATDAELMPVGLRAELLRHYLPDIDVVERITGRNLAAWKSLEAS